jgi:HEAT repeat protein
VGLLDLFGGGSAADKALKLKPKITQKYGDPLTRQKAITTLGELKVPEAVTVLMSRFTVSVDPQTTDADEKTQVFELICGYGDEAVAPVKEFLRRSDSASSWALRILERILTPEKVVDAAIELLQKLGAEYSRDPEKKTVLLHYVEEKQDPRIADAAIPFLEDQSDDVKIAALKVLAPRKHEPAREPVLKLLTHEETGKRVKTQAIATLHDSGFGVQGFREKVEGLLSDPFFIDKSGIVKKRG